MIYIYGILGFAYRRLQTGKACQIAANACNWRPLCPPKDRSLYKKNVYKKVKSFTGLFHILNKSMAISLFHYCRLISTSVLKTKNRSLLVQFLLIQFVCICCGSVILTKLECPSLTVHNYDEVVSFLSPRPRNWFQPSAYSTGVPLLLQCPLHTNRS